MEKKSIVVAGDLIRDHYLVQYKNAPMNYNNPFLQTINLDLPGGAWFLRDLIVMICADVKQVTIQKLPDMNTRGIAVNNAYTTWAQYPRQIGKKELVWRANPFMGCNPPKKEEWAFSPNDDDPDPDVLVLDDLGLGFRNNPQWWPAALNGGRPRRIVLKTCFPCTGSPLWNHLVQKEEYLDNLTVVLDANALRADGAGISETLSWDAVIEELQHEFSRGGFSWSDLGRCRRIVISFGHGAIATFSRCEPNIPDNDVEPPSGNEPSAMERVPHPYATFERLIYHPEELEDSWTIARPGITFSKLSLITAGVTRHALFRSFYETVDQENKDIAQRYKVNPATGEMDDNDMTPTNYRPLNITLGRALAAKRKLHDSGGWITKPEEPSSLPDELFACDEIQRILTPDGEAIEPVSEFAIAFCRRSLNQQEQEICPCGFHSPPLKQCTLCKDQPALLYNVTGFGVDYIAAKAIELVICGRESALAKAPKARYGDYFTVDREEIERINAIRKLIVDYQADPNDKRPLSIAVFGPPGSGKSFAIKELARTIFGEDKKPLQFNLSQFTTVDELHRAFHQVRDASVKGYIPLVFWDEFDSGLELEEWVWLKHFLAPMQDSEFFSNGISHPLGKAIFIFAGGRRQSFKEFCKIEGDDKNKRRDFISRLRGYLNMKGPNPDETIICKEANPEEAKSNNGPNPEEMKSDGATPGKTKSNGSTMEEAAQSDTAYLIRRALLLRSTIERSYSRLIGPDRRARISMAVIHAFLFVRKYLHGARSLESIVKMSGLESEAVQCFTESCLPSESLLGIHATPDFKQRVKENPFTQKVIEDLARATHNAWMTARIEQKRPKNKYCVDYDLLEEQDKGNDYERAWRVEPKLKQAQFHVTRQKDKPRAIEFDDQEKKRLCVLEHEIWMRHNLVQGFEWAPRTNQTLHLHCNIAPFEIIPLLDQELDAAIVAVIPEVLSENKLAIVKAATLVSQPMTD